VLRDDPLNCEVRLSRLVEGQVTPNDRFYVRSHFPVPAIDADRWRLEVHGLVRTPLGLSLDDLKQMPSRTRAVTLECAGNGRSFFSPAIEGEPWSLGAVSTAEWTGVLLSDILGMAALDPGATELIFRGAEGFERSLELEAAHATPVLLVYAMNGQPLPADHGFPLRAIVPGWYAVASVKWLTEIELTDRPFEGFFQTQRYVYEWTGGAEPVTRQKVRSVITQPAEGETLRPGDLTIRGLAWSGSAPVTRVQVRLGNGAWKDAELNEAQPYAWRAWELTTTVERSGVLAIRSRATDASGETQPDHAQWNRLGYGNNSIQKVTVRIG